MRKQSTSISFLFEKNIKWKSKWNSGLSLWYWVQCASASDWLSEPDISAVASISVRLFSALVAWFLHASRLVYCELSYSCTAPPPASYHLNVAHYKRLVTLLVRLSRTLQLDPLLFRFWFIIYFCLISACKGSLYSLILLSCRQRCSWWPVSNVFFCFFDLLQLWA